MSTHPSDDLNDPRAPHPSDMSDVALAYALSISESEGNDDTGWMDQAYAEAKARGLGRWA